MLRSLFSLSDDIEPFSKYGFGKLCEIHVEPCGYSDDDEVISAYISFRQFYRFCVTATVWAHPTVPNWSNKKSGNCGDPHHASGSKVSSSCPIPCNALTKEDIRLPKFPLTAMLTGALAAVSRVLLTTKSTSNSVPSPKAFVMVMTPDIYKNL